MSCTPWIHARVTPPRDGGAAIERVGPLTPYLTQTIVEDARAWGRGSRVLLQLEGVASAHVLRTVRRQIQLLAGTGIRVAVRRRAQRRPESPDRDAA